MQPAPFPSQRRKILLDSLGRQSWLRKNFLTNLKSVGENLHVLYSFEKRTKRIPGIRVWYHDVNFV